MKPLLLYFLRLGTTGFGGPVALVHFMERDLVEKKHWFTKDEFVEGLALAQLAPGPLAAQLAIYLGWLRGGAMGAAGVGFAFVAPSFLMCVLLAMAYRHYGTLPWIQGLFYGIGASVIGIIVHSAFKLVQKTIGRDALLLFLCALTAVLTAWLELEIVWIFIASGAVVLWAKTAPKLLSVEPVSLLTLWKIAVFFTKAGSFVFGSGLVIIAFLHGGVVEDFHWLTEREFIDAVAVAMITPGPIVITVAFIGYLVAGLAGAIVASLGTFLPCYILTVIPAPYYSRFAKNQHIKAFVLGVTTAAIGAIAGASWVLGKKAIFDLPTALIAIATLGILAKTKIPEPIVIAAAGIVGLALKL